MVFSAIIAAADSWTGADGLNCTFCWLQDMMVLKSTLWLATDLTLFFHMMSYMMKINQHSDDSNAAHRTVGQHFISLVLCLFRAFGSTGFVLPVLTGEPFSILVNLDYYITLWVCGLIVYCWIGSIPNGYIPFRRYAENVIYFFGNVCNAVVEVNCLVYGYDLANEKYPESICICLAFSFLGVYGSHVVEKGLGGAFDDPYVNEYILAVFGTFTYKFLLENTWFPFLPLTQPMAQCFMVAMRFSENRNNFRKLASKALEKFKAFAKSRRNTKPKGQ